MARVLCRSRQKDVCSKTLISHLRNSLAAVYALVSNQSSIIYVQWQIDFSAFTHTLDFDIIQFNYFATMETHDI